MTLPTHPYRPMIERICLMTKPVPPDVIEAMMIVESNGVPSALSPSGAMGLLQIIYKYHAAAVDKAAVDLGKQWGQLALYDPEVNLLAGARILRWCYTSDGSQSWERAVRKYHSGSADPPADFKDGLGTTSDQHIAKFRAVYAELTNTEDTPVGFKAHKAIGLANPLYLPDDILFETKIIPSDRNYVRSNTKRSPSEVVKVTRHETANFNVGADAEMHYRWLMSNVGNDRNNAAGYNCVSDDKKIIHMTPYDEVTWAAGTEVGNRTGDHHELCVNSGINHARARYIATRLDAAVAYARGLPVSAVIQHNFWTGKNCPLLLRRDGLWPWYMAEVQKAYDAIKAHVSGTAPAPAPVTYGEPMPLAGMSEMYELVKKVGHPITVVNFKVKTTKTTPRFQTAGSTAKIGADIPAGSTFDVMAEYTAGSTKWYVTPYWTRVRAADTEKV